MLDGERTRDLGQLSDALAASALPAFVRDAGGRYVVVNDAYAELVGLPPDKLVGRTDTALQPADLAARSAELDGLVLGSGSPLDTDETLLARDGRVQVRACRFTLRDGEAAWAVCTALAGDGEAEAGRVARECLMAVADAAPTPATEPQVRSAATDLARSPAPPAILRQPAPRRPTPPAVLRPPAPRRSATPAFLRAPRMRPPAILVPPAPRPVPMSRAAAAEMAVLRAQFEHEHQGRLDAEALLHRERTAGVAGGSPAVTAATGEAAQPVIWTAADQCRLAAALARAQSARGAGHAVLSTIGAATGWHAGAVWRTERSGAMRCIDAWTAPGSAAGGWETGAWQATLTPGTVGVASGAPAWIEPTAQDDCPRARAAAAAGMHTLVVLPAGEHTTVELCAREPRAVDDDLHDALSAAALQLGQVVDLLSDADRPAWSAARM